MQYLDRPNPEEEYVEAAVEGEANEVQWEKVKVEPNYADKVTNNNDEFFVWIIVNKSKQWIEILRKVCFSDLITFCAWSFQRSGARRRQTKQQSRSNQLLCWEKSD